MQQRSERWHDDERNGYLFLPPPRGRPEMISSASPEYKSLEAPCPFPLSTTTPNMEKKRVLFLGSLFVQALRSRSHLRVLASHSPIERTLQLSAERKLAEVGALLLAQDDALLRQRLVLQPRQARLDLADLGRGRVSGPHRRCEGGRHAVRAIANRRSGRRSHDWAGRVKRVGHFGWEKMASAVRLNIKDPMPMF